MQCTQRYWPGCDFAKPALQCRSVVAPPSNTLISTPALGTVAGRRKSLDAILSTAHIDDAR